MKIIAISNQKGGVGKTTTTVNLAAALALAGQRVLLADLDPQGNATTALGVERGAHRSLYDALVLDAPPAELALPTRLAGLMLIPGSLAMAGAEIEVARMDDHLGQLRRALQPLRSAAAFDFVFLDCPPSLGIWMSNALAACDEVLIPVQCEYYALEGLTQLMLVIEEIRSSGANPGLAISGLLLTMHDGRTNLNGAVAEDVRRHMGEVVFETQIPRSIRLGEAPSHGLTIFEHDPHGAGARAYKQLAAEFLDRQRRGIAYVCPAAKEAAAA
ncbi:MAG: ParA family protein [Terrimicrobiaceae bacterium]|nr:ParA family protein [Terrimicrobiaceae bacterium]